MKKNTLIFLVILFFTACEISGQTIAGLPSSEIVKTQWQEAVAAYEAGDNDLFLERMKRLKASRPYAQFVTRNLLRAYALQGDQAAIEAIVSEAILQGVVIPLEDIDELKPYLEKQIIQSLIAEMQTNSIPKGLSAPFLETTIEGELIEGVSYDKTSNRYFLSSISSGNIWQVDTSGTPKIFINNDDIYCLTAIFGLATDSKRNLLWAASNPISQYSGNNHDCKSGLFSFDLETGELVAQYFTEENGIIGDVSIGNDGVVFASDGLNNTLLYVEENAKSLETFELLDMFPNIQGLTFSNDGKILFVSDYHAGIMKVDMRTRKLSMLKASGDFYLGGIDGLYAYHDYLIGVQNGSNPQRIVKLELNRAATAITSLDVLSQNDQTWAEPTLGMVIGNDFIYNGRSHWPGFNPDGAPLPGYHFSPAALYKIDLGTVNVE